MKHLTLAVLLAALTLLLSATAAAKEPERVALVIGNNAYKGAPLKNPINDARAMATTLRRLGFRVVVLLNADQAKLTSGLETFRGALEEGGVGLFYFAGHGMQVAGQNWLLPTQAAFANEADVTRGALSVDTVLAEMKEARLSASLVILDACRNNPFEGKGTARGLAFMNASAGMLLAFATSPDSVAADGEGRHGVYTEALLREMKVKGRPIEEVFRRVRNAVEEKTGGRQTPWESSSLVTGFSFNPSADPKEGPSVGDTRIACDVLRKKARRLMLEGDHRGHQKIMREIRETCR